MMDVGFQIILFVALWTTAANGFHPFHHNPTHHLLSPTLKSRYRGCNFDVRALFSSDADENSWSDGSETSPLEAMRRILELSWDADKMGRVPLDATEGANEVYSALLEKFSVVGDESGIYMVELLLPAYDVTQGERMYDEVMAVEFCVSLAKCLKGKSEILVRDQKTLSTVEKVLNARERLEEEVERSTDDDEENFDDEDEEDEEDYDAVDNESLPSNGGNITLDEDVDSFRQKLMSGWDGGIAKTHPTEKGLLDTTPFASEEPVSSQESSSKLNRRKMTKRYRLASLFGSARISTESPDMPQDVVRAVRNNAMAKKDEENIIILNAHGQDEMVAVRALVDKYEKDRRIILVNCQFSQVPRELQKAEIVYSILPLVAKEKDTGKNLSVQQGYEEGYSKVVVLRRYPKDWEIFVDIGNGFQLVETTPSRPTMEAVTDCLQRYLKSI